jgi:SAM-dependent methyltransferase
MRLPIPPEELRVLTGGLPVERWDNPRGELVFPGIEAPAYEAVFDFGCGCGRTARTLIQQDPRPSRYVGVDLHRGMIAWCQANLAPAAPGFEFIHQDVFNAGLNPSAPRDRTFAPFPVEDGAFSLVLGLSVFTHLVQDQTEPYLREVARVLRPDGVFYGTFFTFDKRDFPMLQDFQNALYINLEDPTNAVMLDRDWLDGAFAAAGLKPVDISPPVVRGFHWWVTLALAGDPRPAVRWPEDVGKVKRVPPPLTPEGADKLGT